MATNDKENESIIFINAKPTLPWAAHAHWAKLQTDIECATSFWWVKGAVGVEERKRKGDLPLGSDIGSMIERNAYRIKVIDYNMRRSGCPKVGDESELHPHEVSKDELQVEIIKNILDGLQILEGSVENFVKVLPKLGESLKNKDKSVMDVESKWILITTWLYDSYKEKFSATMRAIHFLELSGTAGKERWWDISVELRYEQTDFVFNESIWEESKGQVKSAVDSWVEKNTKKILEIAV